MTLAIIKPDFGDLILSAAAIRAVLARHPAAAVFVAQPNLPLARYLFGPTCDLREANFPHLMKNRDPTPANRLDLREFDCVLFLRHDGVLTPQWAELRCRDYIFPVDTYDDHQSMIDFAVVARAIGPYNIAALHYGAQLELVRRKATQPPMRIGLSIGSGFHANAWPAARWIELGQRLQAEGQSVQVFCGPRERELAGLIGDELGLAPSDVVAGGADLAAFAAAAAQMDWFVASDGGTAHLCGMFAPVTSIFGPSPFRRFAPFGSWNRLITQELDCAPCCQWTARELNGCLSMECMAAIGIEPVTTGLGLPYADDLEPGSVAAGGGCRLYFGVSHLGFADKIKERMAA